MAFLMWAKSQQFFDNSGNPLNGGKIRIYDAGTLSAKTVYQDTDETVPWSPPITLDSAGRPEQPVYIGSGPWKYTLETSAGVVFITEDNIPGDTVLTVDEYARPNMPVLSKSLSYTVLADDIGSMIQADATGGDVTITLISAVTAGDGAQIGIQNVGSANRVIVAVPGGQTVNGATTIQILKPRAGGVLTSNAGSWSGPITDQPYTTLSKTTTYTVSGEDYGRTIKCNASGGAFVVTLPPAATVGDGFEVAILKTDSSTGVVTIDGNASETIEGAANTALSYQWQSKRLRCDGSNWVLLNELSAGERTFFVPVGGIIPSALTTEPTGWLFCYGQAVSRTTYAALFAAISTTYGAGDASTTFNLPDLRGRVIAGQDDMGGVSANRLTGLTDGVNGDTLGAAGGLETQTLTTAQLPAHSHVMGVGTVNVTTGAQGLCPNTTAVGGQAAAASTNNEGSGAAHNIVQPTFILNYIIRT